MGLRLLWNLFFILFALSVPAFSQDTAVIDDSSQEADRGNGQDDIAEPDDNSQAGDFGTDDADRAVITDESQNADLH